MLAGGLVFLGTTRFHLGVPGFAWLNVALAVIWLGVAVLLVRGYKNALARAFLEHLKSALVRALIERSGYGLASQTVR